MNCDICSAINVGPDHEISENHLKNQVLYEYSINRKKLAGNRKGAVVTCNVKSSFTNVADCADPKIQVSAKPDEEIIFNFYISNESRKEKLNILFIQIPQNKLNFTMNDHNVGFGCAPVSIQQKKIFPKKIYVKFRSPHIGQYEMPIIFSFRKMGTQENIVIIRDMVVYVEQKQAIHEKVISPYARKDVMADKLVKCTASRNQPSNMFRIPRMYKSVYVSGVKVKDEAPQCIKDLTADINDVFTTGVTRDNYVRFFHHLLWYEETIGKCNLKNYNMSGVPLILQTSSENNLPCLALVVPGLAEKRPSLMLGDILFVKPDQSDEVMFEAVIAEINENYVIIRGLAEEFWKHYNPSARFDIRFLMSRMSLERMHVAVDGVLMQGHADRVFPVENKALRKIKPIKNFYNPLVENNREQRLAVEHIVAGAAGRAPYLLHGPPGTGKTVTVVEAVLQLVNKSPENRILVCTDSNMAADHVATVIIKYCGMFETDNLLLRANSKYRVWETVPEILHKYSNGTSFITFQAVSVEMFLSYRIIVTTLMHAAKFARQFNLRGQKRPISHLFIDEASQASEPSCMVPIVGLLRPHGALVLAGDPLQLGPVVMSHRAREIGLGLSLMERLKKTCPLYNDEKKDPRYMVMLLNNFRSNEDILHIPNQLFYKGQLKALATDDEISKIDILGEKTECRAIVFHGVLSKEQKMGKSPSYYNTMEMEIIQMYVTALIEKHKVVPEDIGIVTPYIRQAYKIKSWLSKMNLHKLEVGTVEAFQGKEKRVILVSTVRANCTLLDHDAKFRLGFLVDDKRFNVALTRAKAKAIIVGNPLCLEKDAKWQVFMQRCRQLGTYRGFDAAAARSAATQRALLATLAPAMRDLKLPRDA